MSKDDIFRLILDISHGYDGYEDSVGLKSLIDEIVELAIKGLASEKETNTDIHA